MKYCRIISCENSRGSTSVHMFRMPNEISWKQQWENALRNVRCTNSNLLCLKHFENHTYEIKSNKYFLKKSSIPTIFADSIDECETTVDCETRQDCENCQSKENEIKFLRQLIAKKETTEESLRQTIELQSTQMEALKEEILKSKEFNKQFDSDLARFAIDDNPRVSLDSP